MADMHSGARALYSSMLRIRCVEEEIARRYAEQQMRCPVHLSIGQEAVAVGVCSQLRPDDKILATHRCHAQYLAKGGDLPAMIAELHGKATGCCGGRGGSMHLFDDAAGILASLPIVGSAIPLAVGAALGAKQAGTDAVAVAFFGDGAIEEGVFHESANFAVLHKLPVLFVCENNLFSVYTHLDQRQPDADLTRLAAAHGMPCSRDDGNDIDAVIATTERAIKRARSGEGPSFLQFDTYRWREHCGPNYDDDLGYRNSGEVKSWLSRCPVDSLQQRLLQQGTLSERDIQDMTRQFIDEVDAAFAAADAAPFPALESAEQHVYAE